MIVSCALADATKARQQAKARKSTLPGPLSREAFFMERERSPICLRDSAGELEGDVDTTVVRGEKTKPRRDTHTS